MIAPAANLTGRNASMVPAVRTLMRPDPAEVRRAIAVLRKPGETGELRILNASTPDYRKEHTVSGYFDDFNKLAAAACSATSCTGVYVTLNPVDPALLARACNRVKTAEKNGTTADHDIAGRRWMLIDCDPKRPAGISSTDAEKSAATERARAVKAALDAMNWPAPVEADSGNGAHLLYRVDLPKDDGGLISRVLNKLDERFGDDVVGIDTAVFNPARIVKLYGTVTRKGDDTPDRPHRLSRLLNVPEKLEPVTREQLEALAGPAQAPKAAAPAMNGKQHPATNGTARTLADWLGRLRIPGHVSDREPWSTSTGMGERVTFDICPFNPDHNRNEAWLGVYPSGAVAAGCQHQSCKWTWADLKAKYDTQRPATRRVNAPAKEIDPAPSGNTDIDGAGAGEGSWADLKPLPNDLPPVEPFDYDFLPNRFQGWIQDIAGRMQCPADYPAVGAMVSMAAVVGRKIGIRPKRHDDWTVVANLWGAPVGRPGIMKSPALAETMIPLKRLEIDAKKEWLEAMAEHELVSAAEDAKATVSKKRVKTAVEKGEDVAAVIKAVKEEKATTTPKPVRRRYIVNDATEEKLGELLNENPNGLLNFRDELMGFFRSLDKAGRESARPFYLEAWNGDGRFTYDRIGRGTVDIDSMCLSMLGGIQPGPLLEYVRGASNVGAGDDGLLQRFQLTVWPDTSPDWTNVDRYPDTEAKNAAYEVFTRIDKLQPCDIDAEHDHYNRDAIPFLRFNDAAQRMFDAWREQLEKRVRSGVEHPAMESHLAKYRSLIPSLALLIHLADAGVGPIGTGPLGKALAWGEYLESHARRVYAEAIAPGPAAAKALARKITEGALSDGFSLRAVYRPGWTHLKTADDAARAVQMLVDYGWLRETVRETTGRTAAEFWINPRVKVSPAPPSVSSVSSSGGVNPSVESLREGAFHDFSSSSSEGGIQRRIHPSTPTDRTDRSPTDPDSDTYADDERAAIQGVEL